jgi:hypothetical protein
MYYPWNIVDCCAEAKRKLSQGRKRPDEIITRAVLEL